MAKILLVDDDIDLLTMLQYTLTKIGYTVQTLSEGEQIFETLANFSPDLVILDINLGTLDGRELCEQIKRMDAYRDLPIILYSAEAHPDFNIAECHAEAFIQKPFSKQIFLQQVKELIA